MDAKFYFVPPGAANDPLDQSWYLGWEVELRDGQRFGDRVRGTDLITVDPLVLGLTEGLFMQAIQVLSQLHRDGYDLAPRTIEYEDARIAKVLAEV